MPLDQPNVTKCPLSQSIELIGGKWRIPVLCVLSGHETIRYNDLKRKVGEITNIMLTQILKDYVEHGLVERIQFNEIPPRVEYSLTPKGKALSNTLFSLAEWYMTSDGEQMNEACKICHSRG